MTTNNDTTELSGFSALALANIAETGLTQAMIADDVRSIRDGSITQAELLLRCLDGADDDRRQGWEDYVDEIVMLAGRRPRGRHSRAARDAAIRAKIGAAFGSTYRQRADFLAGWHEGYRAFAGDTAGIGTTEHQAGFASGYLANGSHREP